MNRRQGVQREVQREKQLMDHDDNDYDDNYDECDYNEDEWEQISYIAETLSLDTRKSAEALQKFDFDQSKAIDYLLKQTDKQNAAKKQAKEKKNQELRELKQKKSQQPQPTTIAKKKSETVESSKPVRKISTEEGTIISTRKSSQIVQQYQRDHYNIDYPDLEVKPNIEPSKTLNIVVVGHVDSGKSTLVGKLMHMIQEIPNKQIHKNQKQAKEIGKQSFKFAWVTDQTEEQRQRGVTIDVGVKKVLMKDRNIVFLDSPGHRDFIPNMITGAAQADYAILVIDVTHFDSTFVSGGQTKQHAYIVKSLGVQTIIVAVNKMDIINWNPESFQTIRNKLNYYLLSIGFQAENIIYVPVSAFYGVNIEPANVKPFTANQTVYKRSIVEVLEHLPLPTRPVNKPLRINITNFYQSPIGKLKGHCISGKIEGGVLRKDQKYLILPQDCQCIVKDILIGKEKVKEAVVGDNVEIQIKLLDETYFQTIKYGNVLSSLTFSIPVTRKFVVQAMALELEMPILKGTEVMIYIGSNKATARIMKINCKYDPKTGAIIKKNCKSVNSNDCVQLQIQTGQDVCVEKFSNSKIFGRVIVREKKSTLCVGTVTMVK